CRRRGRVVLGDQPRSIGRPRDTRHLAAPRCRRGLERRRRRSHHARRRKRQRAAIAMSGGLTLGAALLLGFAASGHCIAMCGGISAALGLATGKRADGRSRATLVVAYQVGRTLSYAIAGALVGGALGFIVDWLDYDAVRESLRAMSALALVVAALVAFGALRDPGSRIG